jgi:hypothetical protein
MFPKYVTETEVSLKPDKNNGYFTRKPMNVYDISLNFSQNETFHRNVQQMFAENRTVYEIMGKKLKKESDRPQMAVRYGAHALHAGYLMARIQIHTQNM